MKVIPYLAAFLLLSACTRESVQLAALQKRVDSLSRVVSDTYRPGLGEFMSSIQVHHAKLWFAGRQRNWKLADFEIHEIKESLESIRKFQVERKESQLVGRLDPVIDSMSSAIQQQDTAGFSHAYRRLTQGCNDCHKVTEFGFNRVQAPDRPPYSNQIFSLDSIR